MFLRQFKKKTLETFTQFSKRENVKTIEYNTSGDKMTFACAARRCNVLRDLAADAGEFLAKQSVRERLVMSSMDLKPDIKLRRGTAEKILSGIYSKVERACRQNEITGETFSNAKSWFYVLNLILILFSLYLIG